jgi:hypothetical protein
VRVTVNCSQVRNLRKDTRPTGQHLLDWADDTRLTGWPHSALWAWCIVQWAWCIVQWAWCIVIGYPGVQRGVGDLLWCIPLTPWAVGRIAVQCSAVYRTLTINLCYSVSHTHTIAYPTHTINYSVSHTHTIVYPIQSLWCIPHNTIVYRTQTLWCISHRNYSVSHTDSIVYRTQTP